MSIKRKYDKLKTKLVAEDLLNDSILHDVCITYFKTFVSNAFTSYIDVANTSSYYNDDGVTLDEDGWRKVTDVEVVREFEKLAVIEAHKIHIEQLELAKELALQAINEKEYI